MSRTISLNARTQFNAQFATSIPIVLVEITYQGQLARFSTDPTVRLSTEPLAYGTVHRGFNYEFVLMSAVLPDDKDNAPIGTSLSFENVAHDQASIIRAMTEPANVDMFVVLHTAPDSIEAQWIGLSGVRGTYNADAITLDISRDHYQSEPWPSERMTKSRFPGQFK